MELSRQEYWRGLPFPSLGDLPDPGVEPRSPALQEDSLPFEPQQMLAECQRWQHHRILDRGLVGGTLQWAVFSWARYRMHPTTWTKGCRVHGLCLSGGERGPWAAALLLVSLGCRPNVLGHAGWLRTAKRSHRTFLTVLEARSLRSGVGRWVHSRGLDFRSSVFLGLLVDLGVAWLMTTLPQSLPLSFVYLFLRHQQFNRWESLCMWSQVPESYPVLCSGQQAGCGDCLYSASVFTGCFVCVSLSLCVQNSLFLEGQ